MKKLTLMAAIAVGLLTSDSQASADMLLLSPNHTFNFDTDSSSDDALTINGNNAVANVQGLSDLAVFLGYRPNLGALQTVQLTGGTVTGVPGTAGFGANEGQFTFNTATVTGANGNVDLDAVLDFQLIEVSATQAQVRYDLSIAGTGITASNGVVSSFVGFDFAGGGADVLESPPVVAPGFGPGTSDVQLGDSVSKSLYGDFTLQSSQTAAIDVYAANFDGPATNPSARFNNSSEQLAAGVNLAFGAFSDFGSQSTDFTGLIANGVVGLTTVPASIPEPSTLMMAAMGLGMVAFRRRKRA